MQLFGASPQRSATSAAQSGVIFDTGIQTFARDVIEASMQTPILVDFWAPWCGPCKQLTPLLEKVVRAAGGKVRLAKVNIDEEPELAQQFRVQSVPTVYAIIGGQPVTGFAGAQPESQVKALVDKLVASMGGAEQEEAAASLEDAQKLAEAGHLNEAAQLFNALLRDDPDNAEAIGGLARVLLQAGQIAEAKAFLDKAPEAAAAHPAVSGARAAIQLAEESGDLGDPTMLVARLEANADDHDSRYKLGTLMFLGGQVEPAMEHMCQIVRRDRGWEDDKARKQLVKFFEALGPKHPMTIKGRRMLSTVLFS